MGKVRYIPNQHSLERYYNQQGSGDMSYFGGPTYQRGHGLGGLFGRLFRAAVPIFRGTVAPALKKVGKKVAKEALTTGVGMASDLLDGQSIEQSLHNRLPSAANRMAVQGAKHLQRVITNSMTSQRRAKPANGHTKTSRRRRTAKRRRKTIKGQDIFT